MNIRIGSRGSALALWQANWVKAQLERKYPELQVQIVTIRTTGDKMASVPFRGIGTKGLFVKEIEEALVAGRIDLAVHSLKDVPGAIPEELAVSAITEREDPCDALVSRDGTKLAELPRGATVGTNSPRRQCQLKHLRPDLHVADLRGNIDTRLRKLDQGSEMQAIVLAAAGLKRLGLEARISEKFSVEVMVPAIGQGALAIETRRNDGETCSLVAFLDHGPTARAARAERAFLKRLGGGCQVPLSAHAFFVDGALRIAGMIGSPDGSRLVKDTIAGPAAEPERLGMELAERLLAAGGDEILKSQEPEY